MHAPQGAKFGDICANTDKFEGSVVREMRRLDELMRNLELAAKVKDVRSLLQKYLTQQVICLQHMAWPECAPCVS